MRLSSILAVATALFATGATASGFPVTLKSCNRDVTFDAAPTRTISNDVNLTEMMLALGLTDHMAGYTGVSDWKTLDERPREGVKELPELSPDYPTKEVLLGADADFYFAGWNYGTGDVPHRVACSAVRVATPTSSNRRMSTSISCDLARTSASLE